MDDEIFSREKFKEFCENHLGLNLKEHHLDMFEAMTNNGRFDGRYVLAYGRNYGKKSVQNAIAEYLRYLGMETPWIGS